jgi:tetratricopeptide (TPR) repeat protein
MRTLYAGLLVLALAVPAALAEGPSPKEARQRLLHGNYDEAREQYEALTKQPQHKIAAVVGLSQIEQAQGNYNTALTILDAALADKPKGAADLHARRAEVLYLRGRPDDAVKAAEDALKLQPDHFLARWVRAEVYRDRGELKKADAEFRWFVRTYSSRSQNDNDIKDADTLVLVGLAGCENARWNNLADQYEFILNEVYADALKYDKDLWWAEYHAGMLLLEKYNRPAALEAFDKALKINPHAAEPWIGKGIAALQKLEIKDAEQAARQALSFNPRLPEALQLRADVHLATGDLAAAVAELEKALKVNPRDEATLGRLAACFVLQHRDADFAALAKEVEQHDAKPGPFYHELAERLEERRFFDSAEKYYKKSAELRPVDPWAQNSLGLLYMRMGREKEARAILTRAFEIDSFNVRVSNTLKVLRHLEKYQTLKTPHFELRYDPQNDQAQARFMAKYLEEIYADLGDKFQYRPSGPILIEVFNSHEMFSGRTIALPDLHTIGACTGRMIAMASPHARGIARPFNWARVLRHELVHIFNLEQTNFLVPHWYTEGLAVSNEGFPRPQPWNQILLRRVPAGDLMNLDNIDLGFIRPRTPEEWHLAYCQSQLYVQFMKETYGPKTVGDLLAAYREGLDTGAALNKACKVDKAAFEKGYRAYLDKVVGTIKGKAAAKAMTFRELEEAHKANPDDADVAARLAEQYLLRRRNKEARELAEAALKKQKTHPLASYVKARLLQTAGEEDEARKLLEAAVDEKAPEPKVLQLLGKMYYENKDFAQAAKTFELGRQAEPYESKWLEELARVYAQSGDRDKQIAVLKDLVPTDADDLETRKRLARLLLEATQYADAERYARQVLEIDVRDAEAQEALFKSLEGQKKNVEADEMRQLLAK